MIRARRANQQWLLGRVNSLRYIRASPNHLPIEIKQQTTKGLTL